MVLRPGAWESSAPPASFPGPQPPREAGGLFLFPQRAEAARLHAAKLHATDFLKKHHVALN